MNQTLANGQVNSLMSGRTISAPWRQTIRWTAAVLLAALSLWLAVGQADWASVTSTIASVDWRALLLALLTVLTTTLLKAVRWQLLLHSSGTRTSFIGTFRVLLIGQMGNSLLPARLGDAARLILMSRRTRAGAPAVVGTLVAEKALDGFLGLLLIMVLAAWAPLPVWLQSPALALALITAMALLLLVLATLPSRTGTPSQESPFSWLPEDLYRHISRTWAKFRLGTSILRSPRLGLAALALSVTIWSIAALTNYAALSGLRMQVPFWGHWLVLATGYVASFLPAVPAQVGVFEYACVLAMTAAGLSSDAALGFGITLHFVVYAPPALLGPLAAASEGLSWRRLWNAR